MKIKRKCYLGNNHYCRYYDEFEVLSELPKECSVLSDDDDKITIIDGASDITNLYNKQDADNKSYNYYVLEVYILHRKTGITEYTTKHIAVEK